MRLVTPAHLRAAGILLLEAAGLGVLAWCHRAKGGKLAAFPDAVRTILASMKVPA